MLLAFVGIVVFSSVLLMLHFQEESCEPLMSSQKPALKNLTVKSYLIQFLNTSTKKKLPYPAAEGLLYFLAILNRGYSHPLTVHFKREPSSK
jgi:hypothetical protein